MENRKKYLRVTFSNNAFYDVPVELIKQHYARYVIQQIDNKPFDLAIMDAETHFKDNDDAFIEFASFGMDWLDVALEASSTHKIPFVNRVKEWATAKKEIIEK